MYDLDTYSFGIDVSFILLKYFYVLCFMYLVPQNILEFFVSRCAYTLVKPVLLEKSLKCP